MNEQVSLSRLGGAVLALLGPELEKGSLELRAVLAVAEELRHVTPPESCCFRAKRAHIQRC